MKRWVKVLIAVVALIILFLIIMFISTSRELKKVRNMTINDVNLYSIDSGTFPGKFRYGAAGGWSGRIAWR